MEQQLAHMTTEGAARGPNADLLDSVDDPHLRLTEPAVRKVDALARRVPDDPYADDVWFQYAMLRSRRAANRDLLLTALVCRFPGSAGALKAEILTTRAACGAPQHLDFPGGLR